MANTTKNVSEELFATLCSQFYLKGFVFHSPKYYDPTEEELGDVVLWIRYYLIVFEIVWRSVDSPGGTKQFIKRIGEKRDQLVQDYRAFGSDKLVVTITSEVGDEIRFDSQYFDRKGFCGVILVDSDVPLDKLHFGTLQKTLEQEFPIAILTKQDFLDILSEVDTIADLQYYLRDRTNFLREVLQENASMFLDLNQRTERELIAFYKMHNNSFPPDKWREHSNKRFWQLYLLSHVRQRGLRDVENDYSQILDEIIDLLRNSNKPNDSTILHSWELAVLPRRARASLTGKIESAFNEMVNGRKTRHFAFLNPITQCWNIFYFQYGGSNEEFRSAADQLAKMKMKVERIETNFQYSVFCFAFRKSQILTTNTFDNVVLLIEDAGNYQEVSAEAYNTAKQYFAGKTSIVRIQEFPQ